MSPLAYATVRRATVALVEPLSAEDLVVQSMPDASPAKWHLAHTTWFFETFVLERFASTWRAVDERYRVLFNSYYNGVGAQHPRSERGLLTRPSAAEVLEYRARVDAAVTALLERPPPESADEIQRTVEVGLHHEQQHQELLLTDVLHLFASNPMRPAYRSRPPRQRGVPSPLEFARFEEGVREIGHAGRDFHFDNEAPRHRTYVRAFALADRAVTNAEFSEFVEDGGYRRADLWLDAGWDLARREGWSAPLYWQAHGDGSTHEFSLAGPVDLDPAAPVAHVSYFEADAFARWRVARLPTEAEWEIACESLAVRGNFVESGALQPLPAEPASGVRQAFGDVWEWTQSDYAPYPGYAPLPGALGEYNGKFMCGQYVLRGGSCLTPASHMRATYRNFFAPTARWQMTGIRLARDV